MKKIYKIIKQILRIIFWYIGWFMSNFGLLGPGISYENRMKSQRYSEEILLLSVLTKKSICHIRNVIISHPEELEEIFEGIDLLKRASEEEMNKIKKRIAQSKFL